MNKFSKVVVAIMVLTLVVMLTACTENPLETDQDHPDPPIEKDPDYHIGIVTLGYDQSEDEIRGAWALIEQYGRVESGGMIKHVVLPDNFEEEQTLVISSIASLADDPLMKAIIVNQAVLGTAAAFRKIRRAVKDDIILIAVRQDDSSTIYTMKYDDLNVISQVADLIVSSDDVTRGYYDIQMAKNMGATTFIFMSFPRHMSITALSKRRDIYEKTCEDLGLEFVFETIPDPNGDVGPFGLSQWSFRDVISHLVKQYGKDTVFSITNTYLEAALIMCVAELGAIFLNQSDLSPACGYPGAFELDLSAEADDWPAMVKKIEEVVVAKEMSGRMGTWPYSFRYCNSTCLARFAMDMIEGQSTGNLPNDIISAYRSLTPGCEWLAQVGKDPDTGQEISNHYLLTMDTYIFGQGYSGVFSR